MKVALTGATGFIGRAIAREFMTSDDTLRAMVRATSDVAFLREGGAELLVGDFGDDASLERLVDDVDVVIHNGYWHDRNELEDRIGWFELNVLSSLKMLEYARLAGCRRFFFISSGAVYGAVPHPEQPIDELTVSRPRGGYAAYNRAVEAYVTAYRCEWDMTGSASIRLCGRNIGVHPKLEMSPYLDVVRAALADAEIRVSGVEQPDMNEDTAVNLRLLATKPLDAVDDVYCFAGDPVAMREVAGTIVRTLDSRSKVVEDVAAGPTVVCSNARLRAAGGVFSGLAGIERYVRELVAVL